MRKIETIQKEVYYCDCCEGPVRPATICVGHDDNSDYTSFMKNGKTIDVCHTCISRISGQILRDMDAIELEALLKESKPKGTLARLDIGKLDLFSINKR